MTIFVVIYRPNGYPAAVSSEGYDSFEKAEEFIKGRMGNPQKVSSHIYLCEECNIYEICEIDVR